MRTTTPFSVAALVAVLTSALPAAGQDYLPRGRQPAWLGVSYEVQWVQRAETCEPRVLVQRVVQGSPAERAGLRAGDAIVAVEGASSPASRLQAIAGRLAPGDSVRLRIDRNGRVREVTAVADRRPQQPPALLIEELRSGFASSSAPVIRQEGEGLVARNVDTGIPVHRGYWLAEDDGRVRYRSLSGWSTDELDERVQGLLRCAARREVEPPARVALELQEVQERADSIRVRIARRALERELYGAQADEDARSRLVRLETRSGFAPGQVEVRAGRPGDPVQVYRFEQRGGDGGAAYFLRVEDHVTAGLRGVAGAEVTALEPELAEYFRGVREGLLILRVAPDTPADRAGLSPGDVIVYGDGRRLDSVAELRALLARPDPSPIELRIVRKGRSRTVTLPRS